MDWCWWSKVIMADFTQKNLDGFTKKKLIRIATYLKLDVSENAQKQAIINAILVSTVPIEVDIPMSVRIRRIRESNKEN
jgi:hypothetical protein